MCNSQFIMLFAVTMAIPCASAADLPLPEAGRFLDNGDGTITDTARRIMWTKADSGKALNWREAWDYCRGLKLAGHTDWRMPNGEELCHKLFDGLQPPGKWIGDRRVPPFEWSGDYYWSSSDADAGHGRPGMLTRDFKQGFAGPSGRSDKHHVRACRLLPRPTGPRFKDNGDGTITDRWEGLTWAKADGGSPMTLDEAEEYCRGLNLGNRKGWRMPTLTELRETLYIGLEADQHGLGLDRRVPPFEWSGEAYWTIDTTVVPEGGAGRYAVRFLDGSFGWVHPDNLRFIRPCRDGS